ncbi:VOC family protein [Streptomyces sp. NPDC053741]|jgi:predicted 3-demethylubiquinone-9 3-methyltransferase (glyoxalase superfamily)|uniref:PhnB-like domain-containing protein n=2 Tax=Streptomyces TaxID=1883 RepID=A0A8D4BBM8_STRFA|nr:MULTISPECIES: VOC family protein [Streptomyces]MBD2833440.1 VOC family protein [Streptomyces pratensis]RAS30330.1 putative 3-demethylubiquinone-9 3-methyltransferase (glyoxalase superfamily) [Streptomyces avidinii]TPN19804.1 VOC family protein [Mesorhizobium sp. B2-3-3]SNX78053.1 Glyoxalase superfamily enzyme, possibly 3-demethylubiquinone-9 3-methyltransferase [Streptomyces microflavus]MCX4415124.1 VOC family protein [[Kitasatospora] papulosa]
MQKIRPCLWFDDQAEEAATFYVSVFGGDSRIEKVTRWPEGTESAGSVLTVDFVLAGQEYLGLNGGPQFHFSEAVSLSVDCADQEEVDRLWAKLTEGGEESMCGWLKDRYGLSWQIVPRALPELLGGPDRARADRAMKVMMGMRKLDVRTLLDA